MQIRRHHGVTTIMDIHAGGLPWPELNGQRDQKNHKPAGEDSRRAF